MQEVPARLWNHRRRARERRGEGTGGGRQKAASERRDAWVQGCTGGEIQGSGWRRLKELMGVDGNAR